MASDSDHLTRTAANKRQKLIATAEVIKIDNLSSTVKRLNLHVPNQQFSFKAGQWVDMFIPGIDTVGGFSMCSAPELLLKMRVLHLAIKFSKHPPALWVHTQCKVGDKVKLRVGGDFHYDPRPNTEKNDILLIAGGVGINPLYSMLQEFLYLHPSRSTSGTDTNLIQSSNISLLYSARNTEELIFQKELIQMTQDFDNFRLKMYSTQDPVSDSKHVTVGRIQLRDIEWALTALDRRQTNVYICGPLPFIETLKSYCIESNIPESNMFFEKWW